MVFTKEKIFVCFLSISLLCFRLPGLFAEEEAPAEKMPAELMLENAIVDLKQTMKDAIRKNEEIEQRNGVLRQEILKYKEDLLELEKEKDQFLDEQRILQEALRLQEEKKDLLLKKTASLAEEQKYRAEKQGDMQKEIEIFIKKQDAYQKEAVLLENEVDFFRKQARKKDLQAFLRDKDSKRKELEEQIAEKEESFRKRKEDFQRAKQNIAEACDKRDRLESEKAERQQAMAELHNQRDSLVREKDVLEKQRASFQTKEEAQLQAFQEDLARLRSYKEQLENGINDMKEAREQIKYSFSLQEKQFSAFKKSFVQEAALLQRQKRELESLVALQKAICDFLPEDKASDRDISLVRESLQDEIHNTKLAIKKAHIFIRDYQKQEKKLVHEIARLEAKKKQVERQASESSESAEDIKEELTRLLSDVEFEDDVPAEAPAAARDDKSPKPRSETDRTVEREIEAMQLREAVLSNSLSIIQTRYEQEKAVVDDFHKEEKELKEYWQVLQQENRALQEKVSGLIQAVEAGE